MHTLQGIPVSPGYGRGAAFVYRGTEALFAAAKAAAGDTPAVERKRFDASLHSTRRELQALQHRLADEYGSTAAHILGAQFLMLEDASLVDAVRRRIDEGGGSAEAVVAAVVGEIERRFADMADPYLRERSLDVHDVGVRILRHLADRSHHPLARLPAGVVIVADRLMPSDTIFLDRGHVGAMVTERGSENSHAAILARALAIPAVTQVHGIMNLCRHGDPVAVDGVQGQVIVHPDGAAADEYLRRERRYRASFDRLKRRATGTVTTKDGVGVRCMANAGREADIVEVQANGAEGIGLLRTEFLFLSERGVVPESEQAEIYGRFAAACSPQPVTIRTLDLAPDKLVPLADDLPLAHASIGERGVHYTLAHREIFRPQLRAILRAASHGNLRVLLPMVTGVDEIRSVRRLLEELHAELQSEGEAVGPVPALGAMIETPPAVLMVREIVAEADFVSLGSNDLLHYLFAADRQFRHGAETSEFEPSLLRAIDATVRAGDAAGKEVALCGEMAGTPAMTVLLVGLGLRVLSMSPQRLAEVRYNVGEIDAARARQLADDVLRLATADEICRTVLSHADPWRQMLAKEER